MSIHSYDVAWQASFREFKDESQMYNQSWPLIAYWRHVWFFTTTLITVGGLRLTSSDPSNGHRIFINTQKPLAHEGDTRNQCKIRPYPGHPLRLPRMPTISRPTPDRYAITWVLYLLSCRFSVWMVILGWGLDLAMSFRRYEVTLSCTSAAKRLQCNKCNLVVALIPDRSMEGKCQVVLGSIQY